MRSSCFQALDHEGGITYWFTVQNRKLLLTIEIFTTYYFHIQYDSYLELSFNREKKLKNQNDVFLHVFLYEKKNELQ